MRIVRYYVAAALALLLLVGIAVSVRVFASAGGTRQSSPQVGSGTPSLGFPAITPHINLNNSNLPTFTTSDVTQYILQHGSPAGPLVKGAHITFEKIVFVTSLDASQLMKGESTGLPNNALVCYVLIHGPFQATGMHLNPVVGPKSAPVVPLTDIVLDARTGNLLVWGIPDISFKK